MNGGSRTRDLCGMKNGHASNSRLRSVRFPSVIMLLIALSSLALIGGCEDKAKKLESIYTLAGTNVTLASSNLATAYGAEELTIQDMLGLAHDRIEKVGDANSVAFAAIVLDLCAKNEAKLQANPSVNEFLWMRIGTLAGNSAARARAMGNTLGAQALVLAGGSRWQTDNYWNQNPEHDALASIILFEAGRTQEALNRLNERSDISDQAREAQGYIRVKMAQQRKP
jgi:hypothetical protein